MEKIEAPKRYAAKEAYEAETAKREAEELSKHEELEIMERIEREKHDIEHEKIKAAEKQHKEECKAEERQRKEDRKAAERHDQLLCDMEKAKLALEQDRINSQQFQQQRDYESKCQFQERQHEDELERLEAQRR